MNATKHTFLGEQEKQGGSIPSYFENCQCWILFHANWRTFLSVNYLKCRKMVLLLLVCFLLNFNFQPLVSLCLCLAGWEHSSDRYLQAARCLLTFSLIDFLELHATSPGLFLWLSSELSPVFPAVFLKCGYRYETSHSHQLCQPKAWR